MTEQRSRLHITPFWPDLAQSIASTYTSLTVQGISYHELETFPENGFGFLELSSMEAEKLKKKLHGSILKGKKLRIEDARPQKRGFDTEDEVDGTKAGLKQRKLRTRTSSSANAELQGHHLSPERKIKRGWTEGAKGQQDCLFRVQMPANKQEDASASTKAGQDLSNAKKRKEKGGTTVVHEFDKSIMQPAFIREERAAGEGGVTAGFVEEKGWVDHHGHIIESVSKRQLRYQKRIEEPKSARIRPKSTATDTGHALNGKDRKSSSEQTDGDSIPENVPPSPPVQHQTPSRKPRVVIVPADEETSSSGTSSGSAESSSISETEAGLPSEPVTGKSDVDKHASNSASTDGPQVHPLEALFKRPKQAASRTNGKRPLEIQTTFNFFEPDGEQTMPQTPFTAKDLQLRGLRSAAPTPDTALPTQRFFPESASPGGNVDAADKTGGAKTSKIRGSSQEATEGNGESEFTKWFWENRGDNNRAWKGRRREAIKENRQRENREKERSHKSRRAG